MSSTFSFIFLSSLAILTAVSTWFTMHPMVLLCPYSELFCLSHSLFISATACFTTALFPGDPFHFSIGTRRSSLTELTLRRSSASSAPSRLEISTPTSDCPSLSSDGVAVVSTTWSRGTPISAPSSCNSATRRAVTSSCWLR